MKEIVYLLMVLLPVFFVVSCTPEKDDKNTKKISKVYYTEDENGEPNKVLCTEYIWSGNLVQEVIDYDWDGSTASTCQYTYDGDKLMQITYTNCNGRHTENLNFTRNGKKIEKIEYVENDELVCVIDCEYEGGNISAMKIKGAYKGAEKVAGRQGRAMDPAWAMLQNLTARAAKNAPKDNDDYALIVNYKYQNGNMASLSIFEPSEPDYVVTYDYTFDDKVNFKKDIWKVFYYQRPEPFSKNNYTAVHIHDTKGADVYYEYDYLYDEDGYPTAFGEDGEYMYCYEYTVSR